MFFTNFFSKTPTITTDKLAELLAKKTPITVLDVRTPPEFHTAHLPNVRNYPLVQIDSYSNSKKNRIYLISQSGKRSEEAAKILRNKGYKAIKDRKSTRLNSSHVSISYAVFCLKKKKIVKFNSSL